MPRRSTLTPATRARKLAAVANRPRPAFDYGAGMRRDPYTRIPSHANAIQQLKEEK